MINFDEIVKGDTFTKEQMYDFASDFWMLDDMFAWFEHEGIIWSFDREGETYIAIEKYISQSRLDLISQ